MKVCKVLCIVWCIYSTQRYNPVSGTILLVPITQVQCFLLPLLAPSHHLSLAIGLVNYPRVLSAFYYLLSHFYPCNKYKFYHGFKALYDLSSPIFPGHICYQCSFSSLHSSITSWLSSDQIRRIHLHLCLCSFSSTITSSEKMQPIWMSPAFLPLPRSYFIFFIALKTIWSSLLTGLCVEY